MDALRDLTSDLALGEVCPKDGQWHCSMASEATARLARGSLNCRFGEEVTLQVPLQKCQCHCLLFLSRQACIRVRLQPTRLFDAHRSGFWALRQIPNNFSLLLCDIEVEIGSIVGLGGAALDLGGDATLGRTANRQPSCCWRLLCESRKWRIEGPRS